MNEEDEAFEELSRKQGYWGLQGSRKHQILRYAENVESKENITQDEIIEMARQAGLFTHKEVQPEIVAFAKLVAEKESNRIADEAVLAERDACAQIVTDDEGLSVDDAIRVCRAIRARGQA